MRAATARWTAPSLAAPAGGPASLQIRWHNLKSHGQTSTWVMGRGRWQPSLGLLKKLELSVDPHSAGAISAMCALARAPACPSRTLRSLQSAPSAVVARFALSRRAVSLTGSPAVS